MAIITSIGVSIVLVAGILHMTKRYLQNKHTLPLPPGPAGIPFLGNVNDMPKPGVPECHHWLQHKDLYGPISSVTVLGQTFIIINDPEIAFELLRDRSAIHSSRPNQVFSGEMVGWRHTTAMTPYTDTWKIHRKNITKIASTNVSLSVFDRAQEAESMHFLLNLLESPEQLFDHIRKEAGSVILKITYGYTTVACGNDPLVDLARKTLDQFTEAVVPGKWMVDILPFLRYVPSWVPGTSFKETAKRMALQLKQCTNQPYEFVKQQMREKRHTPSFLSQCIESIGTDAEMEFIHKWAALSLYLGGADTTVSSIMTFFLAMTLFPAVQEKASSEILAAIGPHRLPVSSDRPRLPYIEAIMKETHRWLLVAPMGLPHASTAEDTCRGYRIPAGSLLLANNFHFTHDPNVYPDPMVFRPERYLHSPVQPDPRQFVFGYGRRICPGRHVADNALFVTIAQVLATFDIRKVVGRDGKDVEPEVRFVPGVIAHPVPFRCKIKVKDGCEELVRKAQEKYPLGASDAAELENVGW